MERLGGGRALAGREIEFIGARRTRRQHFRARNRARDRSHVSQRGERRARRTDGGAELDQLVGHLTRGSEAALPIALRSFDEPLVETGRHGAIVRGHRHRPRADRDHQLAELVPGEGAAANDAFVGDYGNTPEIGPGVDVSRLHLLRTHVVRCADHDPGLGPASADRGELTSRDFGHAKVQNLGKLRLVRANEDIVRLEVAMNDACLVRLGNRAEHLAQERNHLLRR